MIVDMKNTIYNLRFGLVNIKCLSRDEILEVLDFCLPADVIQLCLEEIIRRRNDNLKANKR